MKILKFSPYYELFKKRWYETFKGYYQKGRMDKTKLKENIFNAKDLSYKEKEDFWSLIKGEKQYGKKN